MSGEREMHRRGFLTRGLAAASTALLAGCDELSDQPWVKRVLDSAEELTLVSQRALLSPTALAREYPEADLSPAFKANGSTDPGDPVYKAHAANGFADWKLGIGGLVEQPLELSLAELRAMPSRTQITRHDCVEGWSAIAKWKGVPLMQIIDRVQPKEQARFIVFHCMDTDSSGNYYYESIDLRDAAHPQTILAYEMNDRDLPIEYGAPLRLRLENQLGYKHAKYIRRLEFVEGLGQLGGGKGGYWEDQGYEWYAGI